tara:strand:+ start:2994 stop:3650 length:657 start_codon:yes stop_codon:yes gene_type:complete
MSTKIGTALVPVLFFAGLLLNACQATSTSTTALSSSPQIPHSIMLMQQSSTLYQTGLERSDAIAIALAAELRAEAMGGWTHKNNREGGVPTANDIMAVALKLAESDPLGAAVAQRILERRTRGRIEGPFVEMVTIDPSEDFVTDVTFEENRPVVIYVETPVDRASNVTVRKSDGQVVFTDNRVHSRKLCKWTAEQQETYELSILNSSDSPLEALVITN